MSTIGEFFTGCFERFNQKCPNGLRRKNVKGILRIRVTFFFINYNMTVDAVRKDLPLWVTYFAPRGYDAADLEMFRATLDEVLVEYNKK